MKRLYVIVFLAIAAAAALGLAIAEHSGYVLIAYKSFRDLFHRRWPVDVRPAEAVRRGFVLRHWQPRQLQQ